VIRVLIYVPAVVLLASAWAGQAAEKADRAQLAQCQAEYKVAKALLAKSQKNNSIQHRFIVATDRYATASMFSIVLETKIKYRQALHLYREVLKIDPNNHEASVNSAEIIAVYHSLHRPVPQD
jgi:tetratricopeptide (TPR) repeat protein